MPPCRRDSLSHFVTFRKWVFCTWIKFSSRYTFWLAQRAASPVGLKQQWHHRLHSEQSTCQKSSWQTAIVLALKWWRLILKASACPSLHSKARLTWRAGVRRRPAAPPGGLRVLVDSLLHRSPLAESPPATTTGCSQDSLQPLALPQSSQKLPVHPRRWCNTWAWASSTSADSTNSRRRAALEKSETQNKTRDQYWPPTSRLRINYVSGELLKRHQVFKKQPWNSLRTDWTWKQRKPHKWILGCILLC